jgi:hypothetical protein
MGGFHEEVVGVPVAPVPGNASDAGDQWVAVVMAGNREANQVPGAGGGQQPPIARAGQPLQIVQLLMR